VENVVAANLLAAESPKGVGEALNVACGQVTTLNQIATWLNELLGTDLPAEHVAPRPGDIRHSYASIQKARRLLNYTPETNIRTALARTVDWFRVHET